MVTNHDALPWFIWLCNHKSTKLHVTQAPPSTGLLQDHSHGWMHLLQSAVYKSVSAINRMQCNTLAQNFIMKPSCFAEGRVIPQRTPLSYPPQLHAEVLWWPQLANTPCGWCPVSWTALGWCYPYLLKLVRYLLEWFYSLSTQHIWQEWE